MISKDKLEDIIDNVKTDIEVDIEADGDTLLCDRITEENAINWFYELLKSKLYDYFEFEAENK